MVSWLLMFVAVGGLAGSVSGSHVHSPDVLTGPASVRGNSTGPAFTIAGTGTVNVLERLVFDVGVGAGGKRQTRVICFVMFEDEDGLGGPILVIPFFLVLIVGKTHDVLTPGCVSPGYGTDTGQLRCG